MLLNQTKINYFQYRNQHRWKQNQNTDVIYAEKSANLEEVEHYTFV